jgi:hypothetical protein
MRMPSIGQKSKAVLFVLLGLLAFLVFSVLSFGLADIGLFPGEAVFFSVLAFFFSLLFPLFLLMIGVLVMTWAVRDFRKGETPALLGASSVVLNKTANPWLFYGPIFLVFALGLGLFFSGLGFLFAVG